MHRFKIFITRAIPKDGIDLLAAHCRVEVSGEDAPLDRSALLRKVRDADGVIGLLTDRIDAEFFDAAGRLKGYANYAVGFDNIDVAEATRRKIPVSNTPDVLTQATAELAWTLILATAQRVVECDGVMRSGTWQGWGPLQFLGADVSGKTLGIVGAGRIGTATALLSRGFNMRVLYTSASKRNQVLERELNAQRTDLDTLLRESDFVSIHAPLTPATRHLFDAQAFATMKRTAILVNTGRGPIIKEDDLVAALDAGMIAGAGLDVYEREPRMAEGLAQCRNAVLLPHVGSATVSARTAMAVLAAENLLAMLEGRTPPTCLNPQVLAQG